MFDEEDYKKFRDGKIEMRLEFQRSVDEEVESVLYGLPARIRMARNAKGITQEEMAELVGRSKLTYQKYERGAVYPNAAVLAAICTVTGVKAGYLLGLEN